MFIFRVLIYLNGLKRSSTNLNKSDKSILLVSVFIQQSVVMNCDYRLSIVISININIWTWNVLFHMVHCWNIPLKDSVFFSGTYRLSTLNLMFVFFFILESIFRISVVWNVSNGSALDPHLIMHGTCDFRTIEKYWTVLSIIPSIRYMYFFIKVCKVRVGCNCVNFLIKSV